MSQRICAGYFHKTGLPCTKKVRGNSTYCGFHQSNHGSPSVASASSASASYGDSECCVCLEDTRMSTHCGHTLCAGCHQNLRQNICPMCRTSLDGKQLIERQPQVEEEDETTTVFDDICNDVDTLIFRLRRNVGKLSVDKMDTLLEVQRILRETIRYVKH